MQVNPIISANYSTSFLPFAKLDKFLLQQNEQKIQNPTYRYAVTNPVYKNLEFQAGEGSYLKELLMFKGISAPWLLKLRFLYTGFYCIMCFDR